MRTVKLNHAFTARQSPLFATYLLVGGLLFLGASLFYMQHIFAQKRKLETDIQAFMQVKNKPAKLKTNSKETVKARSEAAAVNAAISEIVIPWVPLFKSLETADSPDIKLMTVEPDIKKQVLRLNAVAMDVDSMMRYIDDLSQQNMLRNVSLVKQQNADINGVPALHFVVEAQW